MNCVHYQQYFRQSTYVAASIILGKNTDSDKSNLARRYWNTSSHAPSKKRYFYCIICHRFSRKSLVSRFVIPIKKSHFVTTLIDLVTADRYGIIKYPQIDIFMVKLYLIS